MTKQQAFIDAYTKLKRDAADQGAPILFMDAVHPIQATKITAGWIKRGKDRAINTTGSRIRLNIMGAIQLGQLKNTVSSQYQTLNAESVMDFMGHIRQQYQSDNLLHLILDGAGYRRAAVVKEAAEKLNIHLHFLPPYSPNLNPFERLWKVMNEKVRNNQYFHSAKEFREQNSRFFTTILLEIADFARQQNQ